MLLCPQGSTDRHNTLQFPSPVPMQLSLSITPQALWKARLWKLMKSPLKRATITWFRCKPAGLWEEIPAWALALLRNLPSCGTQGQPRDKPILRTYDTRRLFPTSASQTYLFNPTQLFYYLNKIAPASTPTTPEEEPGRSSRS